jgi:hypothetical protein
VGAVTVPISAAALPLPSGASTETTLAGVKTGTDRIPAQGQAAMAVSTPVVIASNQSAVPVSGTVTANVGTTNGLALDATVSGVAKDATLTGGTAKAIPVAGTTGGATPSKTISAASTNATSVKGSAGTLYGIQVTNINAAVRYLKLYDKATAPTVGTDTPVKVIAIPGNAAGAGAMVAFPVGVAFTLGIAFALTTGATDADTGAVAANEIIVNLDTK